MKHDEQAACAALMAIFDPYRPHLAATTDTTVALHLVSTLPSPFKQHKGQPMFFGSVRAGKAYLTFHLMPLYRNDALTATISPSLKKRMQGKTCFNFKTLPDPAILAELLRLTDAGFRIFRQKGWV